MFIISVVEVIPENKFIIKQLHFQLVNSQDAFNLINFNMYYYQNIANYNLQFRNSYNSDVITMLYNRSLVYLQPYSFNYLICSIQTQNISLLKSLKKIGIKHSKRQEIFLHLSVDSTLPQSSSKFLFKKIIKMDDCQLPLYGQSITIYELLIKRVRNRSQTSTRTHHALKWKSSSAITTDHTPTL
ncbi:hypothetical protein AGLY_010075 [Aphis glycines]|uniref:Uncharacterized protein n=1 Tax=Aphis glycines TaxID=307491 RepID=A0A6G0TF07_APHGL|nr:hypothetical protein AGLY_010075 [Aphis glycines]